MAVLFLFVVMMLDINFARMREGFQRYAPIGAALGVVLFVELVLVVATYGAAPGSAGMRFAPTPAGISNTAALGALIYTKYVFLFQASGLVLLVGIDRFVNAARAVTNLIGNGIATIVVARWEKAFDEKQAGAMLDGAANLSPTDL